jgi:hypothetical protein
MDGRRLGQSIREPDLEDVPYAPFDDGSRNLTIKSPCADNCSGRNRPINFSRLELDGDYLSTGFGLGIFIGLAVKFFGRCGRLVSERAVMRVNVGAVLVCV